MRSSLKSKPTGMQGSILARLDGDRGEKTETGSNKAFRIRKWHWAVLFAVVAGVAAWLLRERMIQAQFQWKAFAASFRVVNWWWIAASWFATFLTYYGRALRWRVMIRHLQPDASRWRLFKATAIGFTATVLLGRPGEFVRPYLISLKERVPFSSQLAAWFLERIYDLLAVLLIFGFTLSQIDHTNTHLGPKLHWVLEVGGYVVAVLAVVGVVILVMLSRFSETMRRRISDAFSFLPSRYHQKVDRIIAAFLEGTAATKTRSSVIWLGLYTVLEWLLIVVCFSCVFRAYPATAGFGVRDVLVFVGFVAFGGILQIPGVGGGVQIVCIIVLTEVYGLGVELATNMALVIWAITFVGIVPIGLLLAFHEGLNWKRLRELEQDAVASARTTGDAEADAAAGGAGA